MINTKSVLDSNGVCLITSTVVGSGYVFNNRPEYKVKNFDRLLFWVVENSIDQIIKSVSNGVINTPNVEKSITFEEKDKAKEFTLTCKHKECLIHAFGMCVWYTVAEDDTWFIQIETQNSLQFKTEGQKARFETDLPSVISYALIAKLKTLH